MMGSGKLGMYVATADNIPTIVNQYKGKYETTASARSRTARAPWAAARATCSRPA